MREVKFTRLAYSQLEEWKKGNKKTLHRIERLIDAIQENPQEGIGKPEILITRSCRALEQAHHQRASTRLQNNQ